MTKALILHTDKASITMALKVQAETEKAWCVEVNRTNFAGHKSPVWIPKSISDVIQRTSKDDENHAAQEDELLYIDLPYWFITKNNI